MAFDLLAINLAYKADHGDLESLAVVIESGDARRIAIAMGDADIRELIVKLLRGQPIRKRGAPRSIETEWRNMMMFSAIERLSEAGMPEYGGGRDTLTTACGSVAQVYGIDESTLVKLWQKEKRRRKKCKMRKP